MILEATIVWHLFLAGKGFVSPQPDAQGKHQYVGETTVAKSYPTKKSAEDDKYPDEQPVGMVTKTYP